ncbi:MAG TPA: dTDP-4-dehydrorhamnose 3,5-epimerase [Caulobacteraceae bacterium]
MRPQLVKPKRFEDARGWFVETYNKERLADLGIVADFCQDNHSMSREAGVLRGLHFQVPPRAQAKLVRCVRGRIWDAAVDIRAGSPTYGEWVGAELSAENGWQLFVPVGFAHGFVTLEADVEVEYKTTDFYAPNHEGGILWNDADIALPWPIPPGGPVLNERDRQLPTLAAFESPFAYDGAPLAALESA